MGLRPVAGEIDRGEGGIAKDARPATIAASTVIDKACRCGGHGPGAIERPTGVIRCGITQKSTASDDHVVINIERPANKIGRLIALEGGCQYSGCASNRSSATIVIGNIVMKAAIRDGRRAGNTRPLWDYFSL